MTYKLFQDLWEVAIGTLKAGLSCLQRQFRDLRILYFVLA